MNVVFATDEKYAQHCLVALTSLVEHNRDVVCFIITNGLSSTVISFFEQCSEKYGFELNWINIPESFVSKLPLPPQKNIQHISLAAYYRLFVSELLPNYVDKVIYLDCDIIVDNSLQELWNIDIKGRALAVYCPDDFVFPIQVKVYERLDIPRNYNYFNSGVLVINLHYFREKNVQERLMRFSLDYYNEIIYHDQDILNGVLYDETTFFPEKYNMQRSCARQPVDPVFQAPVIIHFSSSPKPWELGCDNNYKYKYFEYLEKTPYKNWTIPFNCSKYYRYIIIPYIKKIIRKIKVHNA